MNRKERRVFRRQHVYLRCACCRGHYWQKKAKLKDTPPSLYSKLRCGNCQMGCKQGEPCRRTGYMTAAVGGLPGELIGDQR